MFKLRNAAWTAECYSRGKTSVTSVTILKLSACSDLQNWFDVFLENWKTYPALKAFMFTPCFQKWSTCFENCYRRKLKTPIPSCPVLPALSVWITQKRSRTQKKSTVRHVQRGKGRTFHFRPGCDLEIICTQYSENKQQPSQQHGCTYSSVPTTGVNPADHVRLIHATQLSSFFCPPFFF